MDEPLPGTPPSQAGNYTGPWFSTQLTLSLTVGLSSFIFFCFARRVEKWKVLYSPRTLLKGFSPHEVHDKQTFFGWILPTLRTSEFTVLQIVGLDAAVLLSFFRMAFIFFFTCTVLAGAILVPINYRENGTWEGVDPPAQNSTHHGGTSEILSAFTSQTYSPKISHGSTLYLTSHLVFTYIFTILALFFLQKAYARYIPLRQLFSLEHAHSIPARTLMVTSLPAHLRSERALAEYFEGIHLGLEGDSGGLGVESVVVVRAVGGMKELLERRTFELRRLEKAWCDWLGNPVKRMGKKAVFGYEPSKEVGRILEENDSGDTTPVEQERTNGMGRNGRLVDIDDEEDELDDDLEANLLKPASSRSKIINESKPRPTIRPSWFGKKVDALDYYAEQFRKSDEVVKTRRKGKFRPTGVAFVTFESLAAAQIAAQTVHYPSATEFRSELAPEPRDIQWFNLSLTASSVFVRQFLVLLTLLVLLSVWSLPVAFLARLLSWDYIEEAAPTLAKWIGKSPRLRGFVQTSLPSLAMVLFNNILPLFLDALSDFQGLQARSWIEYSLMKKYHLSLLFTTLFVFITSSTYSLLGDISESPAKLLDKIASTLPGARNFFVSYVMLSGVALMPLQLLELAVIIPRVFYKMFITRTPRDHAELNAPPMLNLGIVYPQALLIFTLGLTYSIIKPIILPFATAYFALAYLVFKYKLLFVYYRPYESRGQAWPLAFTRIAFGLLIFQTFMLGLFTVRKAFLLSGLMVPLMLSTIYASYRIHKLYRPLSKFVNLSQACNITNGSPGDIVKLRRGHPVTRSQTLLNRGRYGHSDEGVYVVAKNSATDYDQPPLSESYPGVLNTGRRRYGHPALNGSLPDPWLPILEEDVANPQDEIPGVVKDALVLDLRRRWSRVKKVAKNNANAVPGIQIGEAGSSTGAGGRSDDEDPSRAWRGSQASMSPRIMDNEDAGIFSDEEDENEDGASPSRYRTYWVKRNRTTSNSFPPPGPSADASEDEQ